MKKFVCVFMAIFMLFLSSCNKELVEKSFEAGDFSIVLDSSFKEKNAQGAYAYFISKDCLVVCVRDLFEKFEYAYEGYSEEEYADVVCDSNGKSTDCIKKDGNYTYLEYTAEAEGEKYYYNSFIKKGTDAFYIITFAAESKEDNTEIYHSRFIHWMDTVKVK